MTSDRHNNGVSEEVQELPIAGGLLGERHVTVLLVGIGLRLNRGAAAYYRAAWDLSMIEWRLLLVLNQTKSLNVGELSNAADLDKAAVSRGLALLEQRKLVQIEQTRSRGRAAIAQLTVEGSKLCAKLLRVSQDRQERLFAEFSKAETDLLGKLLRRLARALDNADWGH
jgi:DNA-binding MarR family transcriptional regulator